MTPNINIENYEAFYLDYLEGTLSADLAVAFEAFLAAHPDLKLEEEELPFIYPTQEDAVLPALNKLLLKKQVSIDELNEQTADYFFIAQQEGLLSEQDERLLETWLLANANYKNDRALYAKAKLVAGVERFEQKQTLLQKEARVIPLWWTGVAALAAGVALVVTIGVNQPVQPHGKTPVVANHPLKDTLNKEQQEKPLFNRDTPVLKSIPRLHRAAGAVPVPTNSLAQSTPLPDQEPVISVMPQEHHLPNNIAVQLPVAPLTHERATQLDPLSQEGTEDLAYVSWNDMKNPVAPITTKLSEKLNTTVDFRSAKPTEKQKGGFFIKIGKLEISHQSSKKQGR